MTITDILEKPIVILPAIKSVLCEKYKLEYILDEDKKYYKECIIKHDCGWDVKKTHDNIFDILIRAITIITHKIIADLKNIKGIIFLTSDSFVVTHKRDNYKDYLEVRLSYYEET